MDNIAPSRVPAQAGNSTPNVLIVDDEPKNIRLLEAHLLPENFEIFTASDGQEALDVLNANKIDIVLMDIMMPRLNGLETTQKIRESKELRLIPVILLTSLTSHEDRLKGIRAGCDDFISKPFDENEVLARIRTLLNLNFYRSQLDERQKYEEILKHVDLGIMVLNSGLAIEQCNLRAAQLFDLDPDTLVGQKWMSVVGHLDISHPGNIVSDIQTGPLVFDLERIETDHHKPLVLEVSTGLIKTPSGEQNSTFVVLKDVTLQRKEQYKKQHFLNLLSHKFKTPLNIVLDVFQILKDGTLGELAPEQQKFVDMGLTSSRDFQTLIEGLLAYGMLTDDRLTQRVQSCVVSDLLTQIKSRLTLKYPHKNVQFKFELPPSSQILEGNLDAFQLIFINLMDNAIKFNSNEVPTVTVRCQQDMAANIFEVEDNGQGIAPENLSKIFEHFYQDEKYDTGQVKGLGLGLGITQHLLQKLGGDISVDSRLGEGTKFIVRIPIYTSSDVPSRPVNQTATL